MNQTQDVLHGVTGRFQEGLNMVSATISRIADSAGTAQDKIVKLLEEFRGNMQNGIPELGIPILEPLKIENIEINITSPKLGKIVGYAKELEIRRLSQFKIDYIKWSPKNKLILNITFPRLDVSGEYSATGEIAHMFDIYGKGPFWLKLRGLSLNTVIHLKYNINHNPPYYIESMKVGTKLRNISSNFTNLMDDERVGNLLNAVISRVAPEMVDTLWPEIEPGLSEQIADIINDKLSVLELTGILGRLFGVFSLNTGKLTINN